MSSSDPRVDRGARAAIQLDQPEVPPAAPTPEEQAAAERVLARYPEFRRDQLLPLLHDVHAETGWFSLELTRYLSQRLGVPFIPTEYEPPVDQIDDEYPFMLTTGRRLEFYNTGVQTALYDSARPQEEILEINPQDAAAHGIEDGMRVRVSSRRGAVELRARTDASLYRGLLFMTLHFPDQVTTNFLTIHATDPKSGTAEFKASAVKLEPIAMPAESEGVADASGRAPVAVHEPTA